MIPARVMIIRSTSCYGGPERQIVGFTRRLDRKYFTPVITCFADDLPGCNSFLQTAEACGIETAVLETQKSFDTAGITHMMHLTEQKDIDLLCPQDYRSNVFALLAGRRLGMPVAVTAHGYTYATPRVRLWEYMDRVLLRLSSTVVCVSEKLRRQIVRWGLPENRVHRVYNSIDLAEHGITDECMQPRGSGPTVCSIGRLSPEKGHRYLIDAWPAVLRSFPSARLQLVGDGPERMKLAERMRTLGVEDSVEFVGYTDSPQDYLRNCELFVMPSLTEGLPVALLEACASAKPIIATDVGGIGEVLIPGQTGVLVKAKCQNELAEAINWLLAHPICGREMGRQARHRVEKEFSFARNVPKLQDVYSSCLDARIVDRAVVGGET